MDGLGPIWPATRTQIDGISLGDAWPCSVMPSHPTHPWENIVPFHKLTQWLCYSLMVPMNKLMNVHFAGEHLLTGLPEYRNGGLLIDTGLLTLKPEEAKRGLAQYQKNAQVKGQPSIEVVPMFTADDDVIVEWRAVTVGFLDELLYEVNGLLGLVGADKLSLAQMLEAGSWKVSALRNRRRIRQLTPDTGWSRNSRSLAAEHERAADHDLVRRDCFLNDTPPFPHWPFPYSRFCVWTTRSSRRLHTFFCLFSFVGGCVGEPAPSQRHFIRFLLRSAARRPGALGPFPESLRVLLSCPYVARTCSSHPKEGIALQQGNWKARAAVTLAFHTFRYPGGAGLARHVTGGLAGINQNCSNPNVPNDALRSGFPICAHAFVLDGSARAGKGEAPARESSDRRRAAASSSCAAHQHHRLPAAPIPQPPARRHRPRASPAR